MRKEFRTKLNGDESKADASAYFKLPFDTRDVWGRAKVPVLANCYFAHKSLGIPRPATILQCVISSSFSST